MAGRYTATVSSDAEGTNTAQVGFTSSTTISPVTGAMLVACYLNNGLHNCAASGTRLQGITYRGAGTAGAISIAWNTEIYNAINTYLAGLGGSPLDVGAYGVDIGQSGLGLAPVGTSIVMSERTATLGRTGLGRHYLPFIAASAITTAGLLNTATGNAVEGLATDLLKSVYTSTVGFGAAVSNSSMSAFQVITEYSANSVVSNLRSRRR